MVERLLFSEGAADEAIEVFDLTALPRMVRFAEVELCVQELGSIGVCGKFQSVVHGDRVHPRLVGQEHFEGGEGDESGLPMR